MSKYVTGLMTKCHLFVKHWNLRDIHGYPGHPIDAATVFEPSLQKRTSNYRMPGRSVKSLMIEAYLTLTTTSCLAWWLSSLPTTPASLPMSRTVNSSAQRTQQIHSRRTMKTKKVAIPWKFSAMIHTGEKEGGGWEGRLVRPMTDLFMVQILNVYYPLENKQTR